MATVGRAWKDNQKPGELFYANCAAELRGLSAREWCMLKSELFDVIIKH